MVRLASCVADANACSPHPRGDGPYLSKASRIPALFSPPAWGWSAFWLTEHGTQLVLPTRVGMVRGNPQIHVAELRSPHPRGDGPGWGLPDDEPGLFSPPAWGWSVANVLMRNPLQVLPTRVGMVRGNRDDAFLGRSSPHPRGDGPWVPRDRWRSGQFSPPAWGWSVKLSAPNGGGLVLPTRVGMVRPPEPLADVMFSSPHPRGDGPFL